jgi:hypothetical protein
VPLVQRSKGEKKGGDRPESGSRKAADGWPLGGFRPASGCAQWHRARRRFPGLLILLTPPATGYTQLRPGKIQRAPPRTALVCFVIHDAFSPWPLEQLGRSEIGVGSELRHAVFNSYEMR